MTAICIPGFGDTSRYWAHLIKEAVSTQVLPLEWVGLWGTTALSSDPIEETFDAIRSTYQPGDIIIAHSMGARLALEFATLKPVTTAVLLAPAVWEPSFLNAKAVTKWATLGYRETLRPSKDGTYVEKLEIPYAHANSWLTRPLPAIQDLRVEKLLVSTMSQDEDNNHAVTTYLQSKTSPKSVDGPHRWWEDSKARDEVRRLVAGKLI